MKLPRHVYSPNSEVSVSNDGKIPDFCKFLFLSSVIKFDNEMSQLSQNKDHNRPSLVYAKSKFTLQDAYDVIYSNQGNSIILEIAATLLFNCVTILH